MTPTALETTDTNQTTTGTPPPGKRKPQRLAADDAAEMDMVNIVITIFIFASLIGVIAEQLTGAAAELTAFPGAGPLLLVVPIILIAVLLKRMAGGAGRGRLRRLG